MKETLRYPLITTKTVVTGMVLKVVLKMSSHITSENC